MYVNMQSESIIFSNETGMFGSCSLSHENVARKRTFYNTSSVFANEIIR